MIDVEQIHDIPNIENHLEKVFELEIYDIPERLQIYTHKLNTLFYLCVEIHCQENLIEGKIKLIDLITQDDISFLQFSLADKSIGKNINSWWYRPLVDYEDKTFNEA